MLLKEQALKRIQSQFNQKKGHRRTKSLDDNWDAENETSKPRNDKITDKDKEKVRVEEDAKEKESSNHSNKPTETREGGKGDGRGGEREIRAPYLMIWRDREREKEKERERSEKGERDREKEEQQRHKDGRSWEKDFLAGYARLKQHYVAKLQASDGGGGTAQQSVPSPPSLKRGGWWDDHGSQHHQQYFNGMALDGNSEWAGAASEEAFTYYDLSPSSKMEGIVSKGLKTKFAPYFFEVHTGCIIYDRIHFKGSIALRGGEHAVEVKHSQGPLPRVLFEQTEGHIFWIQCREDDSSAPPVSSSPGLGDRRDTTVLTLAASSKDEMMDWVHAMRGPQKDHKRKKRGKEKSKKRQSLEPPPGGPQPGPESPEKAADPKGSAFLDDGVEVVDSPTWKKEGWLWVKSSRPGDVWSSYYCLTNEHTFEWFKRGVKQMISLENVSEIKTKVLPKGKVDKVRSSTFLTAKKQATTTNSVHLQTLKDYTYKITLEVKDKIPYMEKFMGKFKFMVDSEERMTKWVSSVRAQTGKPPRIGKKHFETPLGEAKTFRSTVAMRAPKGTPIKIQSALTKINTTPETGKAFLHNFLRDLAERGDAEMGKTPLGNYRTDAPMPKDGKYRIITFDGGGLRSVVSIIILERLVEVFPDLLERVNLFCGTSGGAILAASLAMGRSPTWIKTIMLAFGKHIFTRKARQFVTTARYDNNTLRLMGEEMFGTLTIKDAPRSLIITAFQLDNGRVGEDFHSWIPRIFHNLPPANPRAASHFPQRKGYKANPNPADKGADRERETRPTPERDGPARQPVERLVASGPPAILAPKSQAGGGGPSSLIQSFYGPLGGSGRGLSTSPPASVSPPSAAPSPLSSAVAAAAGVEDGEGQPRGAGEAVGDADRDDGAAVAGKDEEEPSSGFPVPVWPSEEDLSLTLSDLLLASAAAPTFFPTHKGFVDGGVFAHNPCMTAVSSVVSPEHANQQKPSQLEVLSLGTGRIAQYVEGDDLDWGIMQWARKLPDMIFGAAVWNAALLCRMQLGKNFHRLDPILEKPIPMDDATQMGEIINVGMQIDLDDTIDWIREHFYGMETKKHKKKKAKHKPRRKTGASQWWGQSQIFGEMFSSDEDAINQSRKKEERKKGRSWLKSKLGKPTNPDESSGGEEEKGQGEEEEEEESYEEYIKHTITETEDDSPPDVDADNDADVDNDDSDALSDEDDTDAGCEVAFEEEREEADDDYVDTNQLSYGEVRGRRATAPVHNRSHKHGGTGGALPERISGGLGRLRSTNELGSIIHVDLKSRVSVDEAEEEEEEDLKTEIDDKTDSSTDADADDRPRSLGNGHHDGGKVDKKEKRGSRSGGVSLARLLVNTDEDERDTSDKESEAMVEDDSLVEMGQDLDVLNREIARLVELKREREQKMEAILRRRERERKLQIKRQEKEREKEKEKEKEKEGSGRVRTRQGEREKEGRRDKDTTSSSPPHKKASGLHHHKEKEKDKEKERAAGKERAQQEVMVSEGRRKPAGLMLRSSAGPDPPHKREAKPQMSLVTPIEVDTVGGKSHRLESYGGSHEDVDAERGNESDDDRSRQADGAGEGKAKESQRDDGAGVNEDNEDEDEDEDEEEEAEERKLVEVINSFLRREKKEKDPPTAAGALSPRRVRRSDKEHGHNREHGKEKRRAEKEEGKKGETLSPAARRRIFHSFSSTTISTLSSHLSSFAFYSSDKLDKQQQQQQQQQQQTDPETERKKSPRSTATAAKEEVVSSSPAPANKRAAVTPVGGGGEKDERLRSDPGDGPAGHTTAGGTHVDNDEEREREREKKGHSNIATFINKRISEMREHRRKRSASVPTPENSIEHGREEAEYEGEEDD